MIAMLLKLANFLNNNFRGKFLNNIMLQENYLG